MIKPSVKLAPAKVPDKTESTASVPRVPWHPAVGVLYVFFVFFATQFVAGAVLSIYSLLAHQTSAQADNWLNNSVGAQFIYLLLTESLVIGAIYIFLRINNVKFSLIGLKKPRWSDPTWGLAMLPVYFILYFVVVGVVSHFVPSLNVNQQQQIGFNNVYGPGAMVMTFISLVILPPLAEEIMVRGFLYSSLKKGMPTIAAALLTSLLFASAHLPEGGAAGPLYIAAIDTFVLSLVLIYIREKTGSLWGCITLHALKNGIAFVALFVLSSR